MSQQIVVAIVEYDRPTDEVTREYLAGVVTDAIGDAYPRDLGPIVTVHVVEGAR